MCLLEPLQWLSISFRVKGKVPRMAIWGTTWSDSPLISPMSSFITSCSLYSGHLWPPCPPLIWNFLPLDFFYHISAQNYLLIKDYLSTLFDVGTHLPYVPGIYYLPSLLYPFFFHGTCASVYHPKTVFHSISYSAISCRILQLPLHLSRDGV